MSQKRTEGIALATSALPPADLTPLRVRLHEHERPHEVVTAPGGIKPHGAFPAGIRLHSAWHGQYDLDQQTSVPRSMGTVYMRYPTSRSKVEGQDKARVASRVSKALQALILRVPSSTEAATHDPKTRALRLAAAAARRAGAISTALALPPGPVGLVTVLPDLIAIWELQSQLVADIAAVYGHSKALTKTSLIYCLFRHGSAALVRDLVVRTGGRLVVRGASIRMLQGVISRLGVRVTEQVLGKALSRFIPILGALGVGAYAYYDTSQVAADAIDLFSSMPMLDERGEHVEA